MVDCLLDVDNIEGYTNMPFEFTKTVNFWIYKISLNLNFKNRYFLNSQKPLNFDLLKTVKINSNNHQLDLIFQKFIDNIVKQNGLW